MFDSYKFTYEPNFRKAFPELKEAICFEPYFPFSDNFEQAYPELKKEKKYSWLLYPGEQNTIYIGRSELERELAQAVSKEGGDGIAFLNLFRKRIEQFSNRSFQMLLSGYLLRDEKLNGTLKQFPQLAEHFAAFILEAYHYHHAAKNVPAMLFLLQFSECLKAALKANHLSVSSNLPEEHTERLNLFQSTKDHEDLGLIRFSPNKFI